MAELTRNEIASDVTTERWLLACCMQSRQAVAEATEIIEPADFFRPQYQDLFLAIVSMYACDLTADPVALASWLDTEGGWPKGVDRMHLFGIFQIPAVVAQAAHYAETVKRLSARRRMAEVGLRLQQRAAAPDCEPATEMAAAQDDITQAFRSMSQGSDRLPAMNLAVWTAVVEDRLGAVIPGLLDHQDRVLIVGHEGDGKTTLAYQVAFASSAGVHPFADAPIPPVRAMIFDFENPDYLMRRAAARMIEAARRWGEWDPSRIAVISEPGGVDLSQPADRFLIEDRIRKFRPDLIVAGPVYKMIRSQGRETSEEVHSHVTEFWDRIRSKHKPALWLEHHAPKAWQGARRLEPLGSSLYMRWPEFGFGLARAKPAGTLRIVRFRGDREQGRPWPEELRRNSAPLPCWPWQAVYPQGTFIEEPPE